MNIYTAAVSGASVEGTVVYPISSQSEPLYYVTLKVSINDDIDNSSKLIFFKRVETKKNVKLRIICGYLRNKIEHCLINEHYYIRGRLQLIKFDLRCNIEWLKSVIETEFDYHLGKKLCTKKINEKYMREYMATQLSGYGDRFYDSSNNISMSKIASMYPMKVISKKKNAKV